MMSTSYKDGMAGPWLRVFDDNELAPLPVLDRKYEKVLQDMTFIILSTIDEQAGYRL